MLGHEGPETILSWVAALPAPLVRQRPLLGCAEAWALVAVGRLADADGRLSAVEAALGALDGAARRAVAGQVAAHRAYLRLFQGAFADAIAAARQALADLPGDDVLLRARSALVLASGLRFTGRLRDAEAVLAPLAGVVQAQRDVYLATRFATTLAALLQERGQLRLALEALRQALAVAEAETGGADHPFAGLVHIAVGEIQHERGELDAAVAAIGRGVALCRTWQQTDALAIGLIALAEAHQDRGALDLAGQALDELGQVAALMGSPWGRDLAATYRARLDLARGDVAAAGRWAQERGAVAAVAPPGSAALDVQTVAEVLVAQGDDGGALRVLGPLAAQLRAGPHVPQLLDALVWQARALAGLGRRREALAALGEAVALGAPEGFVRPFAAGGPAVAELLRELPPPPGRQAEPWAAYRSRLLAALGAPAAAAPPEGQAPPPEPLNERELAVLRLMAAGLANREIGEQLLISVNTVRWYASQIFAKLGVSGRGAAVARGRQLGLV